ncbi:MAG: histidine kinase, partial [candidate division NC10 bacterium]|nr:histidine kinase [candidate division NC10 bacterium]
TPTPPNSPPALSQPLRVLLVEHGTADIELCLDVLKRAGFTLDLRVAATAEQFAACLRDADFDVIIADYRLPEWNGMEALDLLLQEDRDIPFILVTGWLGDESAVECIKRGVTDYVLKDRLGRLPEAVRSALREKALRVERRALEQQLRQAQKYEAIGQLVGGIAHDFNNVIGAILGWAEMGMDEVPPDSRAHSYFKKTRAQADRAAALIRQLLAFARRQILEPRNLSLHQSVVDLTSMLESLLDKNIEVKTVLAPDLAIVCADPTQIEQILLNLCINARDAMPGGGRLVIETENVDIDDEYCRLHPYSRPGRYARLTVSDTGTGMDPDTLEHIFEPFFTTKEAGRGTGLGLATAFGIVKQHGGFLHVYSELRQGSVFHIYLPAVEARPDLISIPEEEAARGGSETILLAEDHEGLRETARSTLEKLGYRVLPFPDGAAALDHFRRQPDRIDLALLDVVMPHLNGPEAYALMEVVRPGLPVLFTSGYTSETPVFTEAQKRGLPILPKPYSSSQLARKVREALDRHLAPAPSRSHSSLPPSSSPRR